ncbi:MAG: shikimate dehydrogenase [Hyphomicrobiales bacterium]|nr:shikimate dehydrogenase [Hyphomicrobiales bacterium]
MEQSRVYRLAGVMGYPVMHSRSPLLHNTWMEEHGITGHYVPLSVQPANLVQALRALPALSFSGVNLTIPHKEAALAIVDRVDELALRIGAVNCVCVAPDGKLEGFNFDAFGFVASVDEANPGWRRDGGKIAILGSGGAARAIIAGLLQRGARDIVIVNRTRERADQLAKDMGEGVTTAPWEQRSEILDGAAMLVNTTSMGMQGQPDLTIDLGRLPQAAVVCDIVYVPLQTSLLKRAHERGNRTVDGLGMLLHQARPAFAKWFGVLPNVTPELRAKIVATL